MTIRNVVLVAAVAAMAVLAVPAAKAQIGIGIHIGPPVQRHEVMLPRPYADAVWVRGYWMWRPPVHRYAWVPGRWIAARPGFDWTDGGWARGPGGWAWREGAWGERRHERMERDRHEHREHERGER